VPILIISVVFMFLTTSEYFKKQLALFSLVVLYILVYTTFNIFNIVRLEQDVRGYFLLNTRYSEYVSLFFVDIVLIAVFMFVLLVLREGELRILVKLGVYKNVEELTDKEIISEYNKLKKQSAKLQNRLKKSGGDIVISR